MGTLSGVWTRLKAPLETAKKSTVASGGKADPKKSAHAIEQFLAKFAPVMAEFDNIYKEKAKVDASFRSAAEKGLAIVQAFTKEIDAAHKDGFNPDNTLQGNIDDRLSEMTDRLNDLKRDGTQVQWD